jgi:hypothetical protein
MKSSGVSAIGYLAKDPATQTKLPFYDEVQEIMGHDWVIPRRRIHFDRW